MMTRNIATRLCAALAISFALLAQALGATANYVADISTKLNNPERGFYYSISGAEWCNGTLQGIRDGGSSIGGETVRLFLYTWTPGSSLSQVTADLACVRAAGVKIIFSPVYCSTQFCNEAVSITTVEAQMAALAPYLLANRDVVAHFRMGVIGAWGEWADSGAGLDTVANKVRVRNAVLNAVPAEIPILTRHSWDIMSWYSSPNTGATAFTGSPQSRIGIFNDCLMADPDDSFSYPGPATVVGLSITSTAAQQRNYTRDTTRYVASGGETCNAGTLRLSCGSPGYASAGTDNAGNSAGIMNEGPRYHMTYLHRGYYTAFHSTWISQGCYAPVTNLLGYRLQLDSLTHTDAITRGNTAAISLKLRNNGWGIVNGPRLSQIRFVKQGGNDVLGSDAFICWFGLQLRKLPPQATRSEEIKSNCKVPSGVATGIYDSKIVLPDLDLYRSIRACGADSCAVHDAYRIQPANATNGSQSWDGTKRRWNAGTSLTVN